MSSVYLLYNVMEWWQNSKFIFILVVISKEICTFARY